MWILQGFPSPFLLRLVLGLAWCLGLCLWTMWRQLRCQSAQPCFEGRMLTSSSSWLALLLWAQQTLQGSIPGSGSGVQSPAYLGPYPLGYFHGDSVYISALCFSEFSRTYPGAFDLKGGVLCAPPFLQCPAERRHEPQTLNSTPYTLEDQAWWVSVQAFQGQTTCVAALDSLRVLVCVSEPSRQQPLTFDPELPLTSNPAARQSACANPDWPVRWLECGRRLSNGTGRLLYFSLNPKGLGSWGLNR